MADKKEYEKFKTPEFRVSFPKLFKPEAFKEGDEPKFSITMLVDGAGQASDAYKKLRGAAKKAFVEKFGLAEWDNTPKDAQGWPVGYHNPFATPTPTQLEKYDGYEEGTIILRASTKFKTPLVDENVQEIIEESKFYAGCYAWAYVQMNAYKNGANKGVSFYLQGVQKTRDCEAFSGRANAEDMFDKVGSNDEAGASADEYDF